MPKLWQCLESVAAGMAPAVTWQTLLGDEWDVARTALMGRRPDRAVSLPCPRGGEPHTVVDHAEDDIVAVPDDKSCTCADQVVTADDVAQWQVSPKKLGRALAKVLELQSRYGDTGIDGVHEIGAFSGHAVPMFLILARDGVAFRAALSELVARQEAFGLIAPTPRYLDAHCSDLLGRRRTVFVDLETNIEIAKSGTLQVKAGVTAGELLKGLLPKDQENVSEDLALQALAIVKALDSDHSFRKAPIMSVFRLYCGETLSAERVARKLRCSKGIVMKRLRLLEAKLGRHPQELRGLSNHFNRIEEELSDSRASHIHRRSLVHGQEEEDEEE